MEKSEFRQRMAELRINKGVSARDMSLSIGQSPGYINNIENGVNYPSMTVFFYICDFFGITPQEFFDTNAINPSKSRELAEVSKGLNSEQIEILIQLANDLQN